jgi:hypothetical protein
MRDPKDTVQDASIVYTGYATGLVLQERLNGSLFKVAQFIAYDSSSRLGARITSKPVPSTGKLDIRHFRD